MLRTSISENTTRIHRVLEFYSIGDVCAHLQKEGLHYPLGIRHLLLFLQGDQQWLRVLKHCGQPRPQHMALFGLALCRGQQNSAKVRQVVGRLSAGYHLGGGHLHASGQDRLVVIVSFVQVM